MLRMIDTDGQYQLADFGKSERKIECRRWTCSACGRNVGQQAAVCPNWKCRTVFVN